MSNIPPSVLKTQTQSHVFNILTHKYKALKASEDFKAPKSPKVKCQSVIEPQQEDSDEESSDSDEEDSSSGGEFFPETSEFDMKDQNHSDPKRKWRLELPATLNTAPRFLIIESFWEAVHTAIYAASCEEEYKGMEIISLEPLNYIYLRPKKDARNPTIVYQSLRSHLPVWKAEEWRIMFPLTLATYNAPDKWYKTYKALLYGEPPPIKEDLWFCCSASTDFPRRIYLFPYRLTADEISSKDVDCRRNSQATKVLHEESNGLLAFSSSGRKLKHFDADADILYHAFEDFLKLYEAR
ncbi:hypothetical protein NHQ30_008152 [Ciborinia camelliae]|nr:hypothetical protein NHQ30_008152 [Ciborinia camelliae]